MRRPRRWTAPLALLGAAAVFVAGLGVGEAIHDRPVLGGTQTVVRTLKPLPLAPVFTRTVTVTTAGP